jgi:exonuclease SbcC
MTEGENLALAKWAIEESTLPPTTDIRGIMKDIGETEDHLRNLESELAGLRTSQSVVDSLNETERGLPLLKKALEEKDTKIEELKQKKWAAEKSAKVDEINTIDNDLQSARSEKESYTSSIIIATETLKEIDKTKQEMAQKKWDKDILHGGLDDIVEKSRKVGLIKDAFSSKGIETLVCDYILPKLEDKINRVLGKLSDFTIRLDTQKPSADGEGVVEGLWITILNELGEELPYESYSGGEKVRITFAISEAFASLGQNRIGFRLVDEAVLALDENSLQSFMEVVGTLLSDFEQVLFISHIQEVKDLFDKQLKINKNNGISYVQPA